MKKKEAWYCPFFTHEDPLACHECFDPTQLEDPQWLYENDSVKEETTLE